MSMSSTNLGQPDDDEESPLIEEFLHGVQYYETIESTDKSQIDVGQGSTSLLEFFAKSAPKGICPFALADMCNRSLFDFSIQELQQSLEEDVATIRNSSRADGNGFEQYLMVRFTFLAEST